MAYNQGREQGLERGYKQGRDQAYLVGEKQGNNFQNISGAS